MTDLFALTYVSEASPHIGASEIDAILLDARIFNASMNVTGALLFGHGRFFQLLEGAQHDVIKTFDKLSAARGHHTIQTLSKGPIGQRYFESWHMGFVHAPATAVQELSQSSWEDAIPYTRADVQQSSGVGLLMYHWAKWAAEPQRQRPTANETEPLG